MHFGSAAVRVELSSPAAFWDIARRAMAATDGTQTLEGIRASSDALHQPGMQRSSSDRMPTRPYAYAFFSGLKTDEAIDRKS